MTAGDIIDIYHRNCEIHANQTFYLVRIYYHIQMLFLYDANSTSKVFILYPEGLTQFQCGSQPIFNFLRQRWSV